MSEDNDPVRLRTACDRCHSQKLRCPKPAGAEVCDRCRKAGRPCVFSPFRQKKDSETRNEKDRESMNAQLFHLEEKIDQLEEKKSKRTLVGVKRKRNALTPPRDSSQYPSLPRHHRRIQAHEALLQAQILDQIPSPHSPPLIHVYFFPRALKMVGCATRSRSTNLG
jgi:hypothetical protein